MTWRRGFTRLWIVLTAAWIATIAGIDRPDKQIALAGPSHGLIPSSDDASRPLRAIPGPRP
jgi:hypothetical protein